MSINYIIIEYGNVDVFIMTHYDIFFIINFIFVQTSSIFSYVNKRLAYKIMEKLQLKRRIRFKPIIKFEKKNYQNKKFLKRKGRKGGVIQRRRQLIRETKESFQQRKRISNVETCIGQYRVKGYQKDICKVWTLRKNFEPCNYI